MLISLGHNPLAVANHFIENKNPIDKQGIDLSELTHKKDSPWDKAWEEGKRIRGFSISNEDIKVDFKNNLQTV